MGFPPYHSLLAASPAIDAGNPDGCVGRDGLLVADQRGLPRQGRCDIGSYEYAPPGPPATVYAWAGTPQRVLPGSPFAGRLRAAVLDAAGTPVPSVSVGFRAPAVGASAVFADSHSYATAALADTGGIATAATATANGTVGRYVVSGSVSGVAGPATFSLTNGGALDVAPTGSDANDCLSRTTPCATPAGALVLASPGDTVYVGSGTYTSTGTRVLDVGVSTTLSGGWNAGFTAQTGLSVLDGQQQRGVLSVNAVVVLERFGMRNGVRNFPEFTGGVLNQGTLTLRLSDVSDNVGAGITNDGTLTLEATTVQGNSNNSGAGGISPLALGGILTVIDSTITDNYSTSEGGGIDVGTGTATILNSTVSGNWADFAGGGIRNRSGGRSSSATARSRGTSAPPGAAGCSSRPRGRRPSRAPSWRETSADPTSAGPTASAVRSTRRASTSLAWRLLQTASSRQRPRTPSAGSPRSTRGSGPGGERWPHGHSRAAAARRCRSSRRSTTRPASPARTTPWLPSAPRGGSPSAVRRPPAPSTSSST